MVTRVDYQCSNCGRIEEVFRSMHDENAISCPGCRIPMLAYFGRMRSENITINYGFRPHRYNNETDRNIAKFQFTHL